VVQNAKTAHDRPILHPTRNFSFPDTLAGRCYLGSVVVADIVTGVTYGAVAMICVAVVILADLVLIVAQWKLSVHTRQSGIIRWNVPKLLRRKP
jgi:hypothetical protein